MIKSVGILGVSNVISQGVAFATSIILAWLLSKSDYGYFRYVIRIGNFLVMFIAAGYSSALTRFIASDELKKDIYISTVIIMVGVLLVIVLPIFLLLHLDILIYLVLIGYSVPLIYYGIIRGFVDYKKMALFNVLRFGLKFILILFIFIFTFLNTPLYVILVYSFGGWFAILILEKWHKLSINIRIKYISKKTILLLTRFSVMAVLANTLYNSIITFEFIILEWRYNYNTLADFSLAVTLTAVYAFVPGAVNTILMPKVAKSRDFERYKFLKQAILINIIYISFIWILIFLFGEYFFGIAFGSKYPTSYYYLNILSIGFFFGGVVHTMSAFFSGINKPEYNSLTFGIAAFTNIIITIYLINNIGPVGAAWGYSISILTAAIVSVIIFYVTIRKAKFKDVHIQKS